MRYLFCLSTTTTSARQTVFLGTSDDIDYNTNQNQNDQIHPPVQNGGTWNAGFAGTTASNGIRLVDAANIGIPRTISPQGPAFPVPVDRELHIPFRGTQGQFDLQVLNTAGEVVSAQRVTSVGGQSW